MFFIFCICRHNSDRNTAGKPSTSNFINSNRRKYLINIKYLFFAALISPTIIIILLLPLSINTYLSDCSSGCKKESGRKYLSMKIAEAVWENYLYECTQNNCSLQNNRHCFSAVINFSQLRHLYCPTAFFALHGKRPFPLRFRIAVESALGTDILGSCYLVRQNKHANLSAVFKQAQCMVNALTRLQASLFYHGSDSVKHKLAIIRLSDLFFIPIYKDFPQNNDMFVEFTVFPPVSQTLLPSSAKYWRHPKLFLPA